MKLLAIFYLVCVFTDWIMFFSGQAAIRNLDLLCYKEDLILVNTNWGSLYMLTFTVSSYIYALFMWYVFYQVPKKHGVVQNKTVDDVGGLIRSESLII